MKLVTLVGISKHGCESMRLMGDLLRHVASMIILV